MHHKNRMRWVLQTLVICVLLAASGPAEAQTESDPPPSMEWGDDEAFLRLNTWHQAWVRATERNPGTQVGNRDEETGFDVGMRRTRFMITGAYQDMEFGVHFGADNQSFSNSAGAQLGIIDAWGAYRLLDKALVVGAGLHYWNGISRLSNNASASSLALDPPILNWPTIGGTDRVARQLGLFAKGQVGPIDYRLALNRPFEPPAGPGDDGVVAFNEQANTWALAGYLQWQLLDSEPNLVPFMPGTRLGAMDILNLGVGAHWQPDGMASSDGTERSEYPILALGADLFWDQPLADAGAITTYLAYYYYDMGPDYLRNVGVMNIGDGGDSLNGPGHAYPTIGTGQHVYAQAGYLLPWQLGELEIQPYVAGQFSSMEALDDPVWVGNAGANWYIYGQTAKITTHYRNRPVFALDGTGESRASEAIVQFQFFL